MAPVVHGASSEYAGRIDFIYLDVADKRNAAAKQQFGSTSTPHFFFVRADGVVRTQFQGVVPRDSLIRTLDALLRQLGSSCRRLVAAQGSSRRVE